MSTSFPIPRPTEDAALRSVPNTPVLPPVEDLWHGLLTAYQMRDREGLGLFAHAVARAGGYRGAR